MHNFQAANDQYLQHLRDESTEATYRWFLDQRAPSQHHIAVMRAAHAAASLGLEAIRATLRDDGWEALFDGDYELDDWRDDWQYGDREDDELFQLAVGFVIGAARAWVEVKGRICGLESARLCGR